MFELKTVNFEEILKLVKEADKEKAFLPSISDKSFSVKNFFAKNKEKISLYGSFLDTKLTGFLLIIFEENDIVSIGPMYISKDFRGLGLGKKQVGEAIYQLRRSNIKGIKTKTWGKNKTSRRIFENLNFMRLEEKLNDRINGDSTIKYFLDLT